MAAKKASPQSSRRSTTLGLSGGMQADELLRILSSALEHSPSVVVITDGGGKIEYVNPQFTEVTGYTPEETLGKHVREFGDGSPEDEERMWDRLISDGEWRGELRSRRKDGQVYWSSVTISRIESLDGVAAHFLGVSEDIREQKRAEEALRESEARNRALLELIPDMMFRMSKDGVYLDFIRGKHTEPPIPASAFLGKRLHDVLPKDVAEQAAHSLKRALRTGEVEAFEHKLTVGDEVRDFDARVMAISDDECLAIVRDVSERKRAEEALRESEAKFRTLAETSGAATFIVQGARFRYVSTAMEATMGYSRQEFFEKDFWDIVHPDHRELVRDRGLTRQRGEQVSPRYEIKVLTKTGEERWFDLTVDVIEFEGSPAVVGTAFDISERKRAEEALRLSEERYRVLYEDNPTMYFTVDTQGTVLSVNRFGAEQLGYTVDELVGQPVLNVFHEDDRDDVREQLAASVRDSGRVGEWEFRKVRKDGSLMWVKEAARAVPAPGGNTIILIVCEDITERRQAEEALQEAREELESRVESRLRDGGVYGLTFRELTVLHLVVAGKSDKEIGAVLGISPRTVSKHVENILGKMNASSRTQAGVRAIREGLLD